jgi:hypothetical protein
MIKYSGPLAPGNQPEHSPERQPRTIDTATPRNRIARVLAQPQESAIDTADRVHEEISRDRPSDTPDVLQTKAGLRAIHARFTSAYNAYLSGGGQEAAVRAAAEAKAYLDAVPALGPVLAALEGKKALRAVLLRLERSAAPLAA